jgi:uncharacterized protein
VERRFDWDREKARQNFRKHGISFDRAVRAFDDPFAIKEFDDRYDYDEDRYQLTGRVDGVLIVVVAYTERPDSTRIIPARKANEHERRKYRSRRVT